MPKLANRFLKPTEDLRNLQLLEEISKDATISQRKLSQMLGVALGVTNACLKKMINKGFVEVKGINHKRIGYYLTPRGFSEKSRLNYHFLQHSIRYYSNLKDNINTKLSSIYKAGHKRIICYGAGEVMEVTFVILNETDMKLLVLGIVDDDRKKQGQQMFGFVIQHPQVIKILSPDAILITSIRYRERILHNLKNTKELRGTHLYSLYDKF